ncbi:MAG: hypothetical protein LAO51_16200 [Acidobacteriia bacterium]|nr:hypothetical protein [Terriglobia bacterium]
MPATLRVLGAVILSLACAAGATALGSKESGFRDTFEVDKADLSASGRSPYIILEPGHRLHFKHGRSTLDITVLDETRMVDGVRTRVVEERETQSGRLVEVSRNYFAIDAKTGAVYYFGESVDVYKNGKVAAHEGAWEAGIGGARFGLMVPAAPKVGDRFYEEFAPGIAMDRAEIAGVDEDVKTPAGTFRHCLHARETSGLEAGTSHKLYAPGVGLVRDDEMLLVGVEP